MKNLYKQIFRDLYESINGLYAFTFYSRYKITPSLLFQFIEKFQKENIVSFGDGKISLTEKGRLKAIKFIRNTTSTNNKFNNIPTEFLDKKLEINSLYLPNIENVNYKK